MSLEKLINRAVILIDKPQGPTSFDVVEEVSKLLKVRKAGHSGTLDPNATGLLLIALGESRKAMPLLTGMDKEYVGVMKVHGDVTRKAVEETLKAFEGVITQLPPVKSAVARKPRKRKVHEIEVIGKLDRDVKFRILCQAGTYVRKIASDAGEKLGCGAHLIELRRTRVGPYNVENSVKPEQLEGVSENTLKQLLIPIEDALEPLKLPKLVIKEDFEKVVRNGSPVKKEFVKAAEGYVDEGDTILVFNESKTLVCMAKYAPHGETIARTDRVFLN